MDVAVHRPRPGDVVVAAAAAGRGGGGGGGAAAARRRQEVQAAVVDFDELCQLGVDVEDRACCCCFCGGLDLADVWDLWSAVRQLYLAGSLPPDHRGFVFAYLSGSWADPCLFGGTRHGGSASSLACVL